MGPRRFRPSTIRIEENCYKGRFGTPKTRSSRRTAALPQVVVRGLLAHRSHSSNTEPEALVFATSGSKPLDAGWLLSDQLKPACKRVGLRLIDFHTLRHTHSTLLHATGTPLKVAQAQLGHSSVAMTLGVYTHALPDAQKQAVERLEDLLFPNVPKLDPADGTVSKEVQQIQ